jgi:hypothetical protein
VSAALVRLKGRLARSRDSSMPIAPALTKLTKPTEQDNSPVPVQPEHTFVSFVSAGVTNTSESQHAIGAPSPEHDSGLDGGETRFQDAPYRGTDETDKSPAEWFAIAEQDLGAEGTTFARVEREMLARLPFRHQKPTEAALRQRRLNALYMREFTPGADTPAGPCLICGDRVSYKLAANSPWRCRGCERPNARLEIHRWFVVAR